MDKQPSFDRSLLLPIGVGIFSLLGICIILAAGQLRAFQPAVGELPTDTPFQYAYVGTVPIGNETPTEEPPAATEPPATGALTEFLTPDTFPTNTLASLITLPPLNTPGTPSRTPTSAFAAPFGAGTYDDVDSRFVYNGNWDRQSNVPGLRINGGTLHVSGTLGNTIKFLFMGNELHVFFQAGPSLGTIRLTLDSTSYIMNEASETTQSYEWVLAATSSGTHTVTITHESGGSVNFDGIVVPVVPSTPTP